MIIIKYYKKKLFRLRIHNFFLVIIKNFILFFILKNKKNY